MLDRTQFYRFEDFIRDTAEARDGDALFAVLQRAVGQYGYDQLIFSAPLDFDLPDEWRRMGVYNTYPDAWNAEYDSRGYAGIDPVLRAAATRTHAFTWEELEKTSVYSDAQKRFMRIAETEAGLYAGIGVPIHSHRSLQAGVGLASRQPHGDAAAHRDLMGAFCNQFYMAFKRLYARPSPQTPTPSLSPKEREILTWVAAGKTDDDIGAILSISRNTVDTHMRSIFRKLDASNRVTAVVRAIVGGHIHP
jgi:DNA-binding CsgD family transcriptional regulator